MRVPILILKTFVGKTMLKDFAEKIHVHNINHLKNFYKDDNTTFEKEFDKYKEETGEENGAQMIMEV